MHVSTDEVYGSIESGTWTRTHPLEPNSPYSASKASSDLLARAFFRTHGLRRPRHPLLEQLRARTSSRRRSSRCSSPTSSTAGTVPLYGDGAQRPGLAPRRRPLPRHPPGPAKGPERRGLQHRRRHRADQQASSPSGCWPRPAPAGTVSSRSRTDWPRPSLLGRHRPRSTTSSATRRRTRSTRVSPRPSSGTRPTATGGSPSRSAERRAGYSARDTSLFPFTRGGCVPGSSRRAGR